MAMRAELITRVMRAQELNHDRLVALPNVIGTGTGFRESKGKLTRDICLQVFVQTKYPSNYLPDWALVPREAHGIDGERIRIDVIEAGFVYAGQDTTRYRPVPGGCSIGHQNPVDAGTLGGWACDLTDDTIVLLSCNHVIANLAVASIPGGIVQPGRLDGGVVPADLIGQLKRFIPIQTGPPFPVNPVDAAIGTITAGRTDNVLNIGPAIYELGAPTMGMAVQKRGRTTQLTNNGTITSLNVTINVNYGTPAAPVIGWIGNSFIVTSTNANAFANRGDSGSLIFSQARGTLNSTFPVVGMFFAVAQNGQRTWHNNIGAVFNQLNLTTICDCVVRALIEIIFGGATASESGSVTRRKVDMKDAQLRKLRDLMLPKTPFGKTLQGLLVPETARLSQVIAEDEVAFGLAARTFGPWVQKQTNLDLLESELDEGTIENFSRLADRISEVEPKLKRKLSMLKVAVKALEGKRIDQVLKAGKLMERKTRTRKGKK